MAFQYLKLKAKIIEKYGTQAKFAEALGTSDVVISNKMNSKTSFTYNDIKKWSDVLEISKDDIGEYFFA